MNFEELLTGGDRRSLGQANKVVRLVVNQEAFDQVFSLMNHQDPIIAMRAADVIEKATAHNSSYLAPRKKDLLKLCATAHFKEVKWHLALLLPRLALTKNELGNAWEIFSIWARDYKESRIVRVNAVQALHDLIPQYKDLQVDFEVTVNEIYRENIPSVNARIRNLRKAKR